MSFIFLRNRVTGGAAFDPASLFSSGEQGAWYEPSTTTAFRSTTDLTPCGYGDSCGFLLDKSQGAGYSGGSFTGLGSELVTNGTFDTDTTGWTTVAATTISSVSGQLNVSTSSAGQKYARQDLTVEVGKTYLVSFDYVSGGGNPRYSLSKTISTLPGGEYVPISTAPDVGSNSLVITATGTSLILTFGMVNDTGNTYIYDNISVREIPGNHATQGTESARPILARVPEGGRRNELSETDTLATQSVTVTAAERTLSFTGTGTVTLTGASTAGPLVGTGAGDRVSLTFTPSAGSLTLTVLGTVTDAQLELGASATTYQSVADSLGYDITEAGVTSLEYLAFDGADDHLLVFDSVVLPAGFQSASDEISIFVGVNADTIAGTSGIAWGPNRTILNLRTDGDPYAVPFGLGFDGAEFTIGAAEDGSPGASENLKTSSPSPSPNTAYVFTSTVNGDDFSIRGDGIEWASKTFTVATGSRAIGSDPASLIIGARQTNAGATANRFDGVIFGLIIRIATSTTDEITNTEAYLAAKSGVTL